jgi:hypothetical protein
VHIGTTHSHVKLAFAAENLRQNIVASREVGKAGIMVSARIAQAVLRDERDPGRVT